MRHTSLILAVSLALATPTFAAQKTTRIPDAALAQAAQLRETALADDTGWKVVKSLTTEVGPRMAGSEADARAVAWAQAKFKELGFDKVWTEPVTFPKWERRGERGEVLGTHAQALHLTALGGSPGGTVEAEVVRFDGLDALMQAPADSLKGKIAFVDFAMQPSRDGKDYGIGGRVRFLGPSEAGKRGAVGFVMRSAGTDSHRVPHTGGTAFKPGDTAIPSAALSVPDAQQLSRLAALGTTKIRVALDCGYNGQYTSQNVIGEITGSRKPKEIVLIGGHLDSWDLGTGAIDDAAGIGISMAAAKLIKPLKPARTIRVVAFANEEQGLFGGIEYAKRHAAELKQHVLVAESDFGAGRIYGFDGGNIGDHAKDAFAKIGAALAPLGVEMLPDEGEPEPDVSPIAGMGAAWAWLGHDGTRYFDLHHTADDTLDKIDPKELAQNVAAYAVYAWLVSQAEGDFGSDPAKAKPPQEF
ncbi:MAG: M28 family peptidase [Pseudoxanthomonas sp.]